MAACSFLCHLWAEAVDLVCCSHRGGILATAIPAGRVPSVAVFGQSATPPLPFASLALWADASSDGSCAQSVDGTLYDFLSETTGIAEGLGSAMRSGTTPNGTVPDEIQKSRDRMQTGRHYDASSSTSAASAEHIAPDIEAQEPDSTSANNDAESSVESLDLTESLGAEGSKESEGADWVDATSVELFEVQDYTAAEPDWHLV
eukprot:CAMPEP_0179079960 /NCGR_PEP_ID=MMETSP0796-20121207/35909_1 /TAXON_ID=73915 /ORGANISM="Pyrodinium bahamense, Strain pbaha01" /LENGTH=202 /DNA_ID=CAMNT_0020777307 /DNA_START=59 /DNA_END=667 /DNA_ORIENTATION=+